MTGSVHPDGWLPGLRGGLRDLEPYFDRHNMPEAGRQLVREAFAGDPKRRVGGGARNMVVRFVSRKMGCVIQCKSRTVARSFVGLCEHSPKIALFLCHAVALHVPIVDSAKPLRRITVTFDYVVYHEDHGFMLVVCKPEPELEKSPRFVRDGDGWRWPAAEAVAADLGLKLWVYSSAEINPVWLRNMDFLADFVGVECPDRDFCDAVLGRVGEARSIRVSTLLEAMGGRTEALWWLIANNHVAADLERELVFDRDWAWVHDSPERAVAWRARRADSLVVPAAFAVRPTVVRIEPDARLRWDGVPWRVLNRGLDKITFQCEGGTDRVAVLSLADVETLLKRGALLPDDQPVLESMAKKREARVLRASPRELKAALARYDALAHFMRHGASPSGVTPRSIRRYQRAAAEGTRLYASQFIGLISPRGRPPDTPALAPVQRDALDKAVEGYVADRGAGGVMGAYAELVDKWSATVFDPPSYESLRRAINALPRSDVARGRLGQRQAVQLEGPAPPLDYVTPPHGDRAFAVGELDHTPFDLPLVSSVTGEVLGTAYLSVLMDAYTRLVLAFVLRFGAPRRMPVLELLYECARRYKRVPDNIVVDGGAEFLSNDVETAFALLDVSKIERAAGRPRQGAVMERLFGISNERMTHEILGNTKLNALGRGLSASHRPARFASWTLARAHQVCERFYFEIYPGLVHGSLGAKPRDVFVHSMAVAGERVAHHVIVDLALRAILSETSPSGCPTRKVDVSRGVFIGYLWYWHRLFKRGDVAGTSVEVKVFPDDCGEVLAVVRGEWRRCQLVDGGADLAGRSWRQIQLVVEELRERHRIGRSQKTRYINAKTIGAFLTHLDAQHAESEAILRQILLDRENALAAASAPLAPRLRLAAVDGEPTPVSSNTTGPSGEPRSSPSDQPTSPDIDFDKLEPIGGW